MSSLPPSASVLAPAGSGPADRGRSLALDATRAVALLGVIVVNAPFFAGAPPGPRGPLDEIVHGLVLTLAVGKFFTIFSFLFGFGFSRLLDQGEPGAEPLARRRLLRRLVGLGALGAVHGFFLFHGDILLLYAVLGLGLWCARGWSSRRLAITGAAILLAGAPLQSEALRELDRHMRGIEALPPGAEPPRGGHGESLAFVLAFNGPVAAAMFVIGLASGREGWFSSRTGPSWARPRAVVAAGCLSALLSGAAVWWARDESQGGPAWLLHALAAPVLAFALLQGIRGLARRAGERAWVRVLAATGRNTLSGYLAHSVLLGALFHAWGLDLFGRLGAAAVTVVALAVFALIVLGLHLWQHVSDRGPAERLLGWWVRLGENRAAPAPVAPRRGAVPGLVTVVGLSLTANQVTAVALPWLVLERTGRAFDAGLLAFCTGAALVLGGWIGGVLADRLGPGRIACGSDLLGALVNAAIPLLALFELLSFPALVVLSALGAMLDPAGVTARETLLPAAARADGMTLEKANSWSEGAQGLAHIAGPALGGLLIAALGASNALLITATFFLATAFGGAVLSARLALPALEAGGASWFGGFAALRADRLLWAITWIGTVWLAALAPLAAIVLPVMFHESGRVDQLGWLLAALGLGGLAGSLAYGRFLERLDARRVLLLGLAGEVAGQILLALSTSLPLQLVAGFSLGLAGGAIMPLINTSFQRRAPAGLLGRVLGTSTSLAMAAAPLGMLGAGWLADTLGPRPTLLVIAAVLSVTLLVATRLGALRELPRERAG